jgi:hypothetical protein
MIMSHTTKGGNKMKAEKRKFEPRVWFNWGYHDGANDTQNGWKRADGCTVSDIQVKHFDRNYADGYVAGVYDFRDGKYTEDSTLAWKNRN